MTNQELVIKFNEHKIAEAVLLLSELHVNKDLLTKIDRQQVREIAFNVIKETAREILAFLMNNDDDALNAFLDDFIKQSNLRYLVNKLSYNRIELPN